jgi:hypothetical protein
MVGSTTSPEGLGTGYVTNGTNKSQERFDIVRVAFCSSEPKLFTHNQILTKTTHNNLIRSDANTFGRGLRVVCGNASAVGGFMVFPRVILKRLILVAVTSLAFGAQVACAQVAIEGAMSYSAKRFGSGPWQSRGSIESITNYDYQDHSGVRALLTFTRKLYVPGRSLKGTTVASAGIGRLEARTRLKAIELNGSKRIPKGKYHAYMLVVDGGNQILAHQKMPKSVSIRSRRTRSSKLFHHTLLDEQAK